MLLIFHSLFAAFLAQAKIITQCDKMDNFRVFEMINGYLDTKLNEIEKTLTFEIETYRAFESTDRRVDKDGCFINNNNLWDSENQSNKFWKLGNY